MKRFHIMASHQSENKIRDLLGYPKHNIINERLFYVTQDELNILDKHNVYYEKGEMKSFIPWPVYAVMGGLVILLPIIQLLI